MNRTLASVLAVVAAVALIVVAAATAYIAVQARDSARQLDRIERSLNGIETCIYNSLDCPASPLGGGG